jgi:inosine-uridine nucleoside N-ribohydrolase
MAQTILDNPGEITVVSVGPFTNLMLARILEPAIVDKVREVIVMGGAAGLAGELGNKTLVGEANADNDPHATSALMRYDWPVTMVGLDVTYTADASTDPAFMKRLAQEAGEPGAFLERINRFYIGFYERARGVTASFQHDSIAVAFAIAPSLFETRRGKVRVITEGVARGQTIFCPEGHHNWDDPEWAGLPTQTVCSKLDGPGFRELYRRTIVEGARSLA